MHTDDENYTQFKVISIDAWQDCGGWYWNDAHCLEEGVWFHQDSLTPRKILRWFRRAGFLSEASKGRVAVDMVDSPDIIEILAKGTKEPIFALSAIH